MVFKQATKIKEEIMATPKEKKNWVTLMLIPHNAAKTFCVQASIPLIVAMGLLWLATVGVASYIITQRLNYDMVKRANIQLTEKNAYFIQELVKSQDSFQRVKKMEDELQAMLQMKSRKALLEYTGEGGPTVADQAQLMKTLKNRPAITASEFDASLGYLRKSATENLETYKELKKYVATQRSLLASIPTAWPVRGWITSRFGMRQSPFWDGLTFHQGLDIANEEGTSVKAPADGVVVYSGSQGSYGNLVVLDHGYGYSTRYGHLQRCLVNVGQRVKRGQVVAFLGDTGRSTAPHLHYEIRVHGIPVDPLKYLKN
jgi:murein DD-endopeptidase MepM/ murein hydrolase activator NlpD